MPTHENFFNLDALDQGITRQLADGMTTRVFAGDDAMISIVRIEPNKSGNIHSHPQEQWGLCLRGSGLRRQGGKEIPVSEGDFWRTPGGVEHGFTAGPDGAVIYDVFAPPREEYRQAGSGFG
ncbi:MAG: cupin domain-containing protein [Gammaproteobacteria bacterium]|nr:cupin domain-containing protein [Gammaproteobacteria bacterium]MDH3447739.1 cupin domain-containing protein [Gammaproteobacteria bacterium]